MGEYDDLYPKPVRLLYYDIETAPLLTFLWSLRQKHHSAEMVEADTFLLSWAAKWSDGETVHSRVLSPGEAKTQDDSRLVGELAELVKKADYVVAHNGDRFDLPMLNGRLLTLGMDPVGAVQSIDTLKLARSTFRLASNKLDYLAQTLGLGEKHTTDFDLWRQCYRGDKKALSRMVDYNRNDVVLLERVFHALKPHVKGLPRLWDATDWRQEFCPACGSKEKVKDGFHRTKANTFQRYRCRNSECGRRYRSWQAVGGKKSGSIGL